MWTEDRQEVLNGFLKYGRVISPEEIDKYRFENEGQEPPEAKPTLEEYQKEVRIFLRIFIHRKNSLYSLKSRCQYASQYVIYGLGFRIPQTTRIEF